MMLLLERKLVDTFFPFQSLKVLFDHFAVEVVVTILFRFVEVFDRLGVITLCRVSMC